MVSTMSETTTPSAFSLVKPSIRVFRKNMATLLIIAFAPILISTIFEALLGNKLFPPDQAPNFYNQTSVIDPTSFFTGGNIALLIVFGLLMLVVMAILTPAESFVLLKGAKNKKTAIEDALSKGWKFSLPFIKFFLLVAIILAPLFLLFVIPGVIALIVMLPRLMIAPFVILEEKTGPMATLKRSGQLAKQGGLWGIIGVTALFGIAAGIAAMILGAILGQSVVSDLVLQLLQTIVLTALAAMPALRYIALKK